MRLANLCITLALTASLLVTALPLPDDSNTAQALSALNTALITRDVKFTLARRSLLGSTLANLGLATPALKLHRLEFKSYLDALAKSEAGTKPTFSLFAPRASWRARKTWSSNYATIKAEQNSRLTKYDRLIPMMKHDLKSWESNSLVAQRLYAKPMSVWPMKESPTYEVLQP